MGFCPILISQGCISMNYLFIRNILNSFLNHYFLLSFLLLNYVQPGFLYNNDGTIREFGVGSKEKRSSLYGW